MLFYFFNIPLILYTKQNILEYYLYIKINKIILYF